MVRERVAPLAKELLRSLRIKTWGTAKPDQTYEYLGGLVGQRHCVLATTVENVARTIRSRVLSFEAADGTLEPLLTPHPARVRRLGEVMGQLTRHADTIIPLEWDALVRSQNTASKVLRAQRAMASIALEPVQKADSELRTFGKREKLKFGKPLRIIQPRDDRYLFSLSRYIKPMEKGLYASIDRELGCTTVMKGLDGVQRAKEVLGMWEAIRYPCAVSVDISKYDASVHKSVLQQEHRQYTRCCPGDSELAQLLRWQLTNKGRAICSDGVVKYGRSGGRMSGDPNTSLGNIIICASAHVMYCWELGIPFRLANDGDDSIVIISQKHLERYQQGLLSFWRDLGFHARVDGVAFEFAHIDFCQSRPVCVNGVWAFVRCPKNAIPKDLLNSSSPTTIAERKAWYAAVGAGGSSQYAAVPMFASFYRMLTRIGVKDEVRYAWRAGLAKSAKFSSTGLVYGQVSPGTRVSFWEAFGVMPSAQYAFEAACDAFQPDAIPDQVGLPPDLFTLTDLLS